MCQIFSDEPYLADLSELKTLYLIYPTFTGEGLGYLTRLPQLSELTLTCAEGLTSVGFESLAKLPHLSKAHLSESHLPDLGEVNLDDWADLEDLDLSSNYIALAGVNRLAKLPKLRKLSLHDCFGSQKPRENGDDAVARLVGLTRLQELDVSMNEITDSGLRHLKSLSSLRTLKINNSPGVTDAGIENLLPLTLLRHLELENGSITNNGLKKLAVLKLQCIKILGTSVTGEGLGILRDWPQLVHLAIDGNQASAFGVKNLSGLHQLKDLDIYSASSDFIEELKREMPNCRIN